MEPRTGARCPGSIARIPGARSEAAAPSRGSPGVLLGLPERAWRAPLVLLKRMLPMLAMLSGR